MTKWKFNQWYYYAIGGVYTLTVGYLMITRMIAVKTLNQNRQIQILGNENYERFKRKKRKYKRMRTYQEEMQPMYNERKPPPYNMDMMEYTPETGKGLGKGGDQRCQKTT